MMIKNTKISRFQLFMLLVGFIFGSASIINPESSARQDAWLAYLIGWLGSYLLLGVYLMIARLNPNQTLVEILQSIFGKYIGNLLALIYVGYFINLTSLILRTFGEVSAAALYPSTPMPFIIVIFALPIVYVVINGLEVMARSAELFIPLIPLVISIFFLLLIPRYNINNLFPMLEYGIKPILKAGYTILTFPFGEIVVFLMVFPALNRPDDLVKISYWALTAGGLILFSVIMRDLLVLGPGMLDRTVFPGVISAKLIPKLNLDPIIMMNFIISGGVEAIVCIYGAVIGIIQIFKLKNYKLITLIIVLIAIVASVLMFDNIMEKRMWSKMIYPLYAGVIQIIIPIVVLLASVIKNRISNN